MKQLLIINLIGLFSFHNFCDAQGVKKKENKLKKNNIQFQADRFYYTKSTDTRYFNAAPIFSGTRGITYKRIISPSVSVRIGYHYLWNKNILKAARSYEASLVDTNSIGKIFSRSKFKFAEMEIGYTKKWKQHSLTLGAGPTFTETLNTYIESLSIIYIPGSPPHVINQSYTNKTEQYFGAVLGLHYDFNFWKDRISAGADIKLRIYDNIPFMYDVYGLHLGYNF